MKKTITIKKPNLSGWISGFMKKFKKEEVPPDIHWSHSSATPLHVYNEEDFNRLHSRSRLMYTSSVRERLVNSFRNNFGNTSLVFTLWIIGLLISALIGGVFWPYAINSWLVWMGKTATVKFWHGALIGFCPGIGQLAFPAAVLTWIVSLFI